jgi:hypothetical protein
VEDGDPDGGIEASDEPSGDASANGSSPWAQTSPPDRRSEWSINWPAVVPVLALLVVVVMLWRAVSGGDDDTVAVGDTIDTVEATVSPTTVAATTTTLPLTTTPAMPTTTATPERAVLIRAEMKPCRFSDNCLVASFTLQGFEQTEGQFTCIYPNSQREFSYRDGGKDDACITADEGDTITIVVDGVRSATVSEENLTGET